MYFGSLRSMLQQVNPGQMAFDEVLRHLLNWSWEEDPRMREQCLAYAGATFRSWPDEARGLFVTRSEELFLEHVFDWESLLRALSIKGAPRFVARVVSALEAGQLHQIRYLHLHRCRVGREQMGALSLGMPHLEGMSLVEDEPLFWSIATMLESMPNVTCLSIHTHMWRYESYAERIAALPHLTYLRVPWGLDDDLRLLPRTLQTLDIRWTDANTLYANAFRPPFEGITLTGAALEDDTRLCELLEARGWRIGGEDPDIPFLSQDVPSRTRYLY